MRSLLVIACAAVLCACSATPAPDAGAKREWIAHLQALRAVCAVLPDRCED